jgi:sulfur carrier protein ThiS
MMKVKVKFFGTLSPDFPGYDPEKGLEVEIADGARVKDLLARLRISEVKGGVVAVDGKILDLEDSLNDGASVHLLQAVYGG